MNKQIIKRATNALGVFLTKLFGIGNISLMRVLTFLVVSDIMIVWTIICIKKGDLHPFDWGTVGVIGTMIGGKAIQRFAENGGEKPKKGDEGN